MRPFPSLYVWKDSLTVTNRNIKRAVVSFSLRIVAQALNEHSTMDAEIGQAAFVIQIENLDSVFDVDGDCGFETSRDG